MKTLNFFKIHKWKYLLFHLEQLTKINRNYSGKIKKSGIDEGIPFVEFNDGKRFYSNPTESYQKRFGFLLKRDIRKLVKDECLNVLFDLLIRYEIPKKDKLFKKTGKYYNFNKGDTIIEIGAYIGYYALKVSEIIGNTGRVIAIEAMPDNYKVLLKNIEYNDRQNMRPINLAVWSKKEELSFYASSRQKNSAVENVIRNEKQIKIQADTIDNILNSNNIKKVDFIRIQVNGAELEVLKGMEQTLKSKPKLLVAVPYMNSASISEYIKAMGYEIKSDKISIFAYCK